MILRSDHWIFAVHHYDEWIGVEIVKMNTPLWFYKEGCQSLYNGLADKTVENRFFGNYQK